jgi:hypothetical protein
MEAVPPHDGHVNKPLPRELAPWSSYFRDQADECRRARAALDPRHSEIRHSLEVLERSWGFVERNWRRIARIEAVLEERRVLGEGPAGIPARFSISCSRGECHLSLQPRGGDLCVR